MQRLTITIPIEDNHGRKLAWEKWQGLEADLQTAFGGFSRVQVSGQWVDMVDGKCRIYKDTSVRYEILTDRDYDKLRLIAERHGRLFGQICVLLTTETLQVEFLPTGL